MWRSHSHFHSLLELPAVPQSSRLGHVSGTFVGTSYLAKGPPTLKQSGKHTASNQIHRSRSTETTPTLVPKHVWTSVSCSSVLSIMVVNHAQCIANGS